MNTKLILSYLWKWAVTCTIIFGLVGWYIIVSILFFDAELSFRPAEHMTLPAIQEDITTPKKFRH